MKRIAIIGGGISGLAAAYTLEKLRRSGTSLEYVLFEASARLGGVLHTERVQGCVVEAGPDSFLTEKSWAADLCRELGIGDQLIASNDARRKTYILLNGKLISLPDGLMFMVPTKVWAAAASPLFSWNTKLRMAREWFYKPQISQDESVASFISRHYGVEMVERLADPLLAGVYGGDTSQLSVQAVLPRFTEMEKTHGSLRKAMLAARKKSANSTSPAKPIFTSLKNGMQQLADALIAQLPPAALRTQEAAKSLEQNDNGWTVIANNISQFDAVILAAPAYIAAKLLADNKDLSAELSSIAYTSSVTVALGYGQSVRQSLPPGFGFLVPHTEGKHLLAATFVHNKFPHRAPDDLALIRCFLGGAREEDVLQLSDEEITRIVRRELQQILGINADPDFVRVYRWRAAMAQYNVGHLERLQRIENLLQPIPGLALAGNGYRGIGIPDCVRSGRLAAEQVMHSVSLP